jgi:hypothetical protein
MNNRKESVVSVEELDALITNWGRDSRKGIDVWSAWRFWYMVLVSTTYVFVLIFNPHRVAEGLSPDPAEVIRLTRFLYFRGWFLMFAVSFGFYAYLRGWYTAVVFAALAFMGSVNLVFDLFTVYPEKLANPTPGFTLLMLVRLAALLFLFIGVKNASRLPRGFDRINLLLPFKTRRPTQS